MRRFAATDPGYGFVDAGTPELCISVLPIIVEKESDPCSWTGCLLMSPRRHSVVIPRIRLGDSVCVLASSRCLTVARCCRQRSHRSTLRRSVEGAIGRKITARRPEMALWEVSLWPGLSAWMGVFKQEALVPEAIVFAHPFTDLRGQLLQNNLPHSWSSAEKPGLPTHCPERILACLCRPLWDT